MTKDEQKSIDKLETLYSRTQIDNATFKQQILALIKEMSDRVEKKHTPIQLESDILQSTQKAVAEAIDKVLTAYGSPLLKLISEVISSHDTELKKIISDSFSEVIRMDEFKQSIVNAFSHKVSRTIISNNDGLFDKVSNELKQDRVFRSKMTLAVSNVVEEYLKEHKNVSTS